MYPASAIRLLCCTLILISGSIYGQTTGKQNESLVIESDSGVTKLFHYSGSCKNSFWDQQFFPFENSSNVLKKDTETGKIKFLTIHGNISYDYFYRSRIDTPFQDKNLEQHTVSAWLDIVVKEQYPIKLRFTTRQSNSPYFRNFLDANFQFDKNTYLQTKKQLFLKKAMSAIPEAEQLKEVDKILDKYKQELADLKSRSRNDNTLQKNIEEKERKYWESHSLPKKNPTDESEVFQNEIESKAGELRNNPKWYEIPKDKDSALDKISDKYEKGKKLLDSIALRANQLQRKSDSLKLSISRKYQELRGKVSKAGNMSDLSKLAKENGVDSVAEKHGIGKVLSSITNLSIGRSMLNYTELTAQYVMISGISIEYNPSYYAAFAAGKINYRFRDFLNKKQNINNSQYLVLGRFGWGNRDKHAVIFTLFQGRKSQNEFAISDSVSNDINITGYSVETIFRKNANTFFSAEFAKSTKPILGSVSGSKQSNDLFHFSDESNMGVNIKGEMKIEQTNTSLGGFFRKTGNNFQSFSLFTYNSSQTAWQARVEQAFWKNKLSVTGMLRQNDFSNVFTEKTYKASTVFKSAYVNVRVPGYPFLTLGYYPGTQLYFIDKDRIRENAYYVLSGTAIHSYRYKGLNMYSSFVFNRYTNKASDSGFVMYKGNYYYASQTVFLKRLQLQAGYAYSDQPELSYSTLDASADVDLKKWLKAGVGAKYNTVNGGERYWGKSMRVSASLKQFGTLQLQYEKSYLPTISSTLYPVEIGRVFWLKNF